jgi:hypothetical protein
MQEEIFTVAIHMGNEAMRTPDDVARTLRRIAAHISTNGTSGFFETIHDDNGNDVGRYKLGPAGHPGEAHTPHERVA